MTVRHILAAVEAGRITTRSANILLGDKRRAIVFDSRGRAVVVSL